MNHVLHDVYRPTRERVILSGKQADHGIGTLRSYLCKHVDVDVDVDVVK